MRKLLSLLLSFGLLGTTPAFADGVVLTTDLSKLKIEIAELPGGGGFVVSWEHLRGAKPSGAMVYAKDKGLSTYFAVGGGGLFSVIDHGGWQRRFSVVSDDPDHPERMIVQSREVDLAPVMAKYAAFENIAGATETRPVIEAAVTAQVARTNQACGGRLAPQIRWDDFTKAGKLALAKQTTSILEAIATTCAGDKDYRAELKKVTALPVTFKADGGALQLAHTGNVLSVVLSDTSFNPRETALVWLTSKF